VSPREASAAAESAAVQLLVQPASPAAQEPPSDEVRALSQELMARARSAPGSPDPAAAPWWRALLLALAETRDVTTLAAQLQLQLDQSDWFTPVPATHDDTVRLGQLISDLFLAAGSTRSPAALPHTDALTTLKASWTADNFYTPLLLMRFQRIRALVRLVVCYPLMAAAAGDAEAQQPRLPHVAGTLLRALVALDSIPALTQLCLRGFQHWGQRILAAYSSDTHLGGMPPLRLLRERKLRAYAQLLALAWPWVGDEHAPVRTLVHETLLRLGLAGHLFSDTGTCMQKRGTWAAKFICNVLM
jgi:hypothetical protein